MAYTDKLLKAMSDIEYSRIAGELLSPTMGHTGLTKVFTDAKQNKRVVYFIGNGGSAAIAIHMTSDYLKNGGIRTHSMHDPAVITCLANV